MAMEDPAELNSEQWIAYSPKLVFSLISRSSDAACYKALEKYVLFFPQMGWLFQ